MRYRADIDGLRALAIIPVILFHAGLSAFSGGFLGVDVFFVISGYLITTILISDLTAGKFSIKAFYERRARRILPALFFVITITTICAYYLQPPESFKEYGESAVAAILSVSNILFWQQADYFNAAGVLKPLLHTWSLGIEEQFYIFFPIGLFLIWKYARAYLEILLIAGFIGSLALAEFMLWRGHVTGNFFLLPSRAWELIAGGYVAYRHAQRPFQIGEKKAAWLAGVGLAAIVGSMMVFNENMRHPGILTAISVVGAATVIAFGTRSRLTTAILANKVPVAIGLISYSLYLWHQPVFSLYRYYSLNDVTGVEYAALVVLSVILAVLTYRYVETPFRNRTNVSVRTVWISSAAMACLLLSVNGYARLSDGAPGRFADDYQKIFVAQKSQSNELLVKRDAAICQKNDISGGCLIGEPSAAPTWALVGDSHAASLGVSLDRALKERGLAAYYFPRFGCAYLPDMEGKSSRRMEACVKYAKGIHDTIVSQGIENVIILTRYVSYYNPGRFNNQEGGVEVGAELRTRLPEKEEAELKEHVLTAYQMAAINLQREGRSVYLIYPVPEVGWNVPIQMFKQKLRGVDEPITTSFSVYQQRTKDIRYAFDELPSNRNLHRIQPARMLCDSVVKDRCVTELGGNIMYFDDDHLSIAGSDLVIGEIMKDVKPSFANISPAANGTY